MGYWCDQIKKNKKCLTYGVYGGEVWFEWKKPIGRPRRKWFDNTKMDHEKALWEARGLALYGREQGQLAVCSEHTVINWRIKTN